MEPFAAPSRQHEGIRADQGEPGIPDEEAIANGQLESPVQEEIPGEHQSEDQGHLILAEPQPVHGVDSPCVFVVSGRGDQEGHQHHRPPFSGGLGGGLEQIFKAEGGLQRHAAGHQLPEAVKNLQAQGQDEGQKDDLPGELQRQQCGGCDLFHGCTSQWSARAVWASSRVMPICFMASMTVFRF